MVELPNARLTLHWGSGWRAMGGFEPANRFVTRYGYLPVGSSVRTVMLPLPSTTTPYPM